MRPCCLISWSGRVKERSISHLWGLGCPICKVGSLDGIPRGALTNSDIPRPCGSQPHLSLGGQSSSVTPCLSPEACLSREAASEELCHRSLCVAWPTSPSSSLVASGQPTAGTARSEASVGPPNPHLSKAEGWDDSSKHGFSEACSSGKGVGKEGEGEPGAHSQT